MMMKCVKLVKIVTSFNCERVVAHGDAVRNLNIHVYEISIIMDVKFHVIVRKLTTILKIKEDEVP